jgi:hypothetical protein
VNMCVLCTGDMEESKQRNLCSLSKEGGGARGKGKEVERKKAMFEGLGFVNAMLICTHHRLEAGYISEHEMKC